MMKLSGGVNVSLVLKFCDFVTGEVIIKDITVMSSDGLLAPVAKPDGYFVFTGYRPCGISVRSHKYHDMQIPTHGHKGTVLRYSPVPRCVSGRVLTVPEGAHVGFDSESYAPATALLKGESHIILKKEDFCDITDLYHAIVTPSGTLNTIYLEKNLGSGRYLLSTSLSVECTARGTTIIPLHRAGFTQVPAPVDAAAAYVLSDGVLSAHVLEVL